VSPARVCSYFLSFLGGFLGAGTGPRGGSEASRGNLAAAVPRHSLDRLNTSNDSLKKKKFTITMGDPSQYITVPTLLRLPIPLQHPLAYCNFC